MNYLKNSKKIGMCVKDNDGRVIEQNDVSRAVCGDHNQEKCDICPVKDVPVQAGITTYKNLKIKNNSADITILNDDENKMIVFKLLAEDIQEIWERVKRESFTKKELEIIDYFLAGKTNQELIDTLTISKSTLKTHINHIYEKMPDLKKIRQLRR